jgi:hypothetical protein
MPSGTSGVVADPLLSGEHEYSAIDNLRVTGKTPIAPAVALGELGSYRLVGDVQGLVEDLEAFG